MKNSPIFVLVYFLSNVIRYIRRDNSNDRAISDQVVIATQNTFVGCGGTMLGDKFYLLMVSLPTNTSMSMWGTQFTHCV